MTPEVREKWIFLTGKESAFGRIYSGVNIENLRYLDVDGVFLCVGKIYLATPLKNRTCMTPTNPSFFETVFFEHLKLEV